MQPLTDAQIEAFMETVRGIQRTYYGNSFPNLDLPAITAEVGQRYVRIVDRHGGQRSVYCFLDRTNGDVLKAASWKAPAKHARGNVNVPGYEKNLGPYGAAYLR